MYWFINQLEFIVVKPSEITDESQMQLIFAMDRVVDGIILKNKISLYLLP